MNLGAKAWFVSGLGAAAVLWRFPPDEYEFYPKCPVHEAFGLLCPGCGATRAASALLHGRFVEAMHWNALFVVALVSAAVYRVFARSSRRLGGNRTPGYAAGLGIAVAIGFGIVRNIP